MPKLFVEQLLKKYPRISDQVDERELRVILAHLAAQLEKLPGTSVVEFGCYIGTTSLFIRRILDVYSVNSQFHVYDSFTGLPPKTAKDNSPAGEQFKTGELFASRKQFELQFKKAGLRVPFIHKAWFGELTADAIPPDISFAYLDGDYYESILDSLALIWPHLTAGAVVVIDDYANEALPGAAKAVDEWLQAHPSKLRVESSLAIISR